MLGDFHNHHHQQDHRDQASQSIRDHPHRMWLFGTLFEVVNDIFKEIILKRYLHSFGQQNRTAKSAQRPSGCSSLTHQNPTLSSLMVYNYEK